MTLDVLLPKTEFIGLDGLTYLYTAAECPMLVASEAALREYARQKSRGEAGRANHAALAQHCKDALARLLGPGVSPEDIALVGSASDAINQVCGAANLVAGDNVVVNDLEFPSVLLPWLRLRERGIEVRVVRHREWDIPTQALLEAVDTRTRVLALSHVSFANGLRHDVEAIGAALQGSRTIFLVDATQSLGVIPVPAVAADFVVSSTYKWLLGTHGLGVLYWNRSRRADVTPAAIGWYSITDTFEATREQRYTLKPDAGRFETGYVGFPAIYALDAALPRLMATDRARVEAHVLALGEQLIDGLTALELAVTTPRSPQRRGASVSFLHADASAVGRALAEERVQVWAGDGRVRASTHLFNDGADVGRYLDMLPRILGSGASRGGADLGRAGTPARTEV